jgi:hypothetical protein
MRRTALSCKPFLYVHYFCACEQKVQRWLAGWLASWRKAKVVVVHERDMACNQLLYSLFFLGDIPALILWIVCST